MRPAEKVSGFRLSVPQTAVPIILGMTLAVGIVYLGLWLSDDPMTAEELRTIAYAAGAGAIGALLLPRMYEVRLTPEGLSTSTPLERRHRRLIPWHDISEINVRRTTGVDRVVISLESGEKVTLNAPMSFLDRKFNDRVSEIKSWRNTHR
ncbi:hypothetical protein [Streptomyces sp. NPDC093071]|uniref:hypothetical protein n=1 Tax=Streptomyces sp. NPDC093071 TaxID=3366022 RepID=UPI0037F30B1D